LDCYRGNVGVGPGSVEQCDAAIVIPVIVVVVGAPAGRHLIVVQFASAVEMTGEQQIHVRIVFQCKCVSPNDVVVTRVSSGRVGELKRVVLTYTPECRAARNECAGSTACAFECRIGFSPRGEFVVGGRAVTASSGVVNLIPSVR